MKEIEVKFKIADSDYDTVKSILEKHLTSKEKSQSKKQLFSSVLIIRTFWKIDK